MDSKNRTRPKENPRADHDAGAAERGFPVIGIGASAGGLAAFEAFFSGMPKNADIGMAFVLVQHLAPDHKSLLTELIQRYTRMKVFEVEDGMAVQPDCAYIIPPARDMAFINGSLQLLEPSAPRGQRLPIDFFFRSLALDLRERAICVVLSGTGSDGTQGVRAIKGEGGMAMAQSLDSTEYDGMPRSAIATGLVDFQLPPAQMAAQIIAYVSHAFGKPPEASAASRISSGNALKKIFVLLRAQTGHDFSQYKPNTIQRRIDRRMAVQQIESLDDYVKYLQRTPLESKALFRDLLIGVTGFFRDPEAFKAIEETVIPRLFSNKQAGAPIRVWIPGCSTGEEAYSYAILIQERIEALGQSYKPQIFATDIDGQSIATARAGLYPASVAADISPERLARYFSPEPGGGSYRINKNVRDILVFSEQDVIKDPPFSRLDLVSCRNLLIYLDADLQKKLIPLFHYALQPEGFLVLGTSETIGDFTDMFKALDRKLKLFQKKDEIRGASRSGASRLPPSLGPRDYFPQPSGARPAPPPKLPLRELAEQALLRQIAPSGALVNASGDILYLYGRTGLYLEPAPGEASVNNIMKMAREGLRHGLTIALRKASGSNEVVRSEGLTVQANGQTVQVNLSVHPVLQGADGPPAAVPDDPSGPAGDPLFLVILEESPSPSPSQTEKASTASTAVPADGAAEPAAEARIQALLRELDSREEYLKSANDQLETTNEELRSSNEEMQSVNEELQSTNEEMETSKEELQSVNEELSTVNSELQTKVADLSRANNDMNNLLAGTDIGTVFLDHKLRILRFTPATTKIINLIAGDVGRPVSHIMSNLEGYDRLVPDTQGVLDTLIPKESLVRTHDGNWYSMKISPYRTVDNVIEGAVITFVDTTATKRAQEALAASESRFRCLFENAKDGIIILDAQSGMIADVNPYLTAMLGYSRDQILDKSIWDLGFFSDLAANRGRFAELQEKEYLRYENLPLQAKDGSTIDVEFVSTVYKVDGKRQIVCMIRDMSEHRRAEAALRRDESLMRTIQRQSRLGAWEWDVRGKSMYWTEEAYRIHGFEPEDGPAGYGLLERSAGRFGEEDRPRIHAAFKQCEEEGIPYDFTLSLANAKGKPLRVRCYAEPVMEDGAVVRIVGFFMDVSDGAGKPE
jgi:two-component system CheB/CheR fusion protein